MNTTVFSKVACLLLSMCALALLGFLPKEAMSASAGGTFQYDATSKTLTISGEVSQSEVKTTRESADWAPVVEHVVFEPGTVLTLDDLGFGISMFSGDPSNCTNLQSITMSGITYKGTYQMALAYDECSILTTINLANPTFEGITDKSMAFSTFPDSLQEINLTGWNPNIFKIDGGGSYSGPLLYYSSNLQKLTWCAQDVPPYGSSELREPNALFPSGSWALTVDEEHYTTVSSYTEWQSYAQALDPNAMIYCIKDTPVKRTFDANGGYFGDTPTTTTVETSTAATGRLTLPAENPKNADTELEFLGYDSNKSATTASIIPGQESTYPYIIDTVDTYYAIWKKTPQSVTLTFNADGGIFASTGTSTLTLTNLTPGETLQSVERPEKAGYEYKGFKDNTGTVITFPYTIPDEDASYTAVWQELPQTVTVMLHADGGTFASTGTDTVVFSDLVPGDFFFPEQPYKGADYKFDYWKDLATGSRFQEPYRVPEQDTTLVAVWSYDPAPTSYTFTLDASPGIFSSGQQLLVQTYGAGSVVKTSWYPEPAYEGHAFAGWADEDGNEVTEVTITKDMTLHALWVSDQGGWVEDSQGWRYFADGAFYNDGWHYVEDEYGNHWYYFDSDSYIATSRWIWDDEYEGWYWLCSTGPMIENLWQWIDNAWYGFWWGGKMCQGWVWDTYYNAWYFCNEYTGRVACNEWAWDGAWYYFNQNCHMLSNCWVGDYWLNEHGMWV